MKEKILMNWSLIRVIRLLLGVGAAVQGILQKELLLSIAGSFILLGAVFNYGCCSTNGCPVSYPNKTDKNTEIKM